MPVMANSRHRAPITLPANRREHICDGEKTKFNSPMIWFAQRDPGGDRLDSLAFSIVLFSPACKCHLYVLCYNLLAPIK